MHHKQRQNIYNYHTYYVSFKNIDEREKTINLSDLFEFWLLYTNNTQFHEK